MKDSRLYLKFFILMVSIITIFRLFSIGAVDLVPDEAYYWQWSRHLDLSYYDHPPMVAYIIFLFTHLGKDTEFFVRLGSVILAFWGTILIYFLTLDMFKSGKTAFYASLLFNLVPLYAIGGILIVPDVPMVFFWLFTLYLLWKGINSGKSYFWYLSGITLGLGLLSKYPMILLPLSIFLFLLFSPENRKYLLRKEPYISLLIALAIFSPVIIWNFRHSWVSFCFQLNHGFGRELHLSFPTFISYIGSQLALISPLVFLGCIFFLVKIGLRAIKDDLFLFLFFPSLIPLAFFAFSSLFAKAHANWPVAGYATLFIALAYFLTKWFSAKSSTLRIWGVSIIASGLFLTGLVHVQAVRPILPLASDPTQRAYGWRESARKIEHLMKSLPFKDRSLPILTPGYPLASELSFYLKGHPYIYPLFAGEIKSQYFFWDHGNIHKGKDVIYVSTSEHLGSGRSFFPRFFLQWEITNAYDHFKDLERIKPFFQSVEHLGSFSILRQGKPVREFALFLGRGFKGYLL